MSRTPKTALPTAYENFWYRRIVQIARGVTRLQGLKVRTLGEENIPASGGAVIVLNHTGYMDFIFGGFIPKEKKRLVRYLTKAGIFDVAVVGSLMRLMGHVPVDRIDGAAAIERGIELAKAGELVGVFPEGTISRSFEIRSVRSGAVRIAHAAGVPIIPEIIVGSQRIWTKGQKKHLGRTNTPLMIRALEPFHTTGDHEADTQRLRLVMQAGVERVWDEYAAEFGPLPKGAYWVPARLGGGAPTLEEVERADRAVEKERRRVRHLRDDLQALKDRVQVAAADLVREVSSRTHKPADAASTATTPAETATSTSTEIIARTEPETLTWIKDNLAAVVDESSRGLEEGRDKVAAIVAQMRGDIAQIQAGLAASGRDIFAGSRVEQGLVAAAAQSMIIISRLPHHVKSTFVVTPAVVFAGENALCCPAGESANAPVAGMSERTVEALAKLGQLTPATGHLVVMSEWEAPAWARAAGTVSTDDAEGASGADSAVPQQLWTMEYQGALLRDGSGRTVSATPLAAALVRDIDAALAEAGIRADWVSAEGDTFAGTVTATRGRVLSALGGTNAQGQKLLDQVQLVDAPVGVRLVSSQASRAVAAQALLDELRVGPVQALAFLSERADVAFLDVNDVVTVALETAPYAALRGAKAVTYGADRDGVAEILEAIAGEHDA